MAAAVLPGCNCGVSGLGDEKFLCASTDDCASGWTCVQGHCFEGDGTCPEVDCADLRCVGESCGSTGLVCGSGTCRCGGNGGAVQSTESSCDDGFDNDCDGLIDCDDPNCLHKRCDATASAAVCCGTGATATVCKNLATDESNCGGCGTICSTGNNCVSASSGSTQSGRCECSSSSNCDHGQSCSSSRCSCGSSSSNCASGQSCSNSVCRY